MTKNELPIRKSPKYGRAKQELIEATLDSLMSEGIEGCSVRKISERANVSLGLINYHFESMDGLIAESYRYLTSGMLDQAVEKCGLHQDRPRVQLSVYLQSIFASAAMNPKTLRAWVVFWGLIDSSELIREVHDETNQSSWLFLEGMFQHLWNETHYQLTPRLAAIGLSSMVDGLWLEKCLQPKSFSSDEAILLCELWIDSATGRLSS